MTSSGIAPLLFAAEFDLQIPEPILWLVAALFAGMIMVVALFVVVRVFRGKRRPADPEAGLREDLAAIPPAPKVARHLQLLVQNHPVRLRFVVVAPMGKRPVGKVDSILEQLLRGLGEVMIDDKPRIRVWPPQLSANGFAPTFFRLTMRPDKDDKLSRWILLAGPVRIGSTPVLLGMALLADEVSSLGHVTMTESRWIEMLRIVRV